MIKLDYNAHSLQGNREQKVELTCQSYFDVAVDELVLRGAELNAKTIWGDAMRMALDDVFGDANKFELHFNYRNSYVCIDFVKAENIVDFVIKAEVFEDLTGFPIEYTSRKTSFAEKKSLTQF